MLFLQYSRNQFFRLKVQLRLQQVVSAPTERREDLLKELEHFAFRGIPNVNSPRLPDENGDKNDQNSMENESEEDKSIAVKTHLTFFVLSSLFSSHTLTPLCWGPHFYQVSFYLVSGAMLHYWWLSPIRGSGT